MASPFDPLYQDAGKRWDVDPLFLRAIAIAESSENPGLTSKAGAGGLMQIMPATAQSLGVRDVYAPAQAVPGAAALTDENLRRYMDPTTGRPDVNRALMAYHGGPDQSKWGPLTQAYPGKVAKAYAQLKADPVAAVTPPLPAKSSAPSVNLGTPAPAAAPAAAGQRSLTVTPAAAPRLSELDDDALAARLTEGAKTQPPPTAAAPTKRMAEMSDDELVTHLTSVPAAGTPESVLSGGTPAAPIVANAIKMNAPAENRIPVAAQAPASMPTDPQARLRVMATQLFPGMPPEQAAARVAYGPDGRMIAVDPQGRPFYAEPKTPSISGMSGFAPGNLIPWVASGAGAAMPIAGGAAGGFMSSPTALVTGPAMAGAGAAGGDALRQYLARQYDPQGGEIKWDPWQTAQEGALGAAGQGVGAVINRVASPNLLLMNRTDRAAVAQPGALNNARTAYNRAQAQGVDLSIGQATGLPSLLGREDVAATTMPSMVDPAREFYKRQGVQLDAAGQRMLDRVSPLNDKTDAALAFQEAAPAAVRAARQTANAAARPAYQAAEAAGAVTTPELTALAEQRTVKAAMERAGRIYEDLYRKPPPATPDFALWDLTKRAMDDMHTAAVRNPTGLQGPTSAMGIDSLRSDLVAELDKAYPSYATARATSAPGQRLAARLEDSIGNAGTGTERAKAIVSPVFETNNPRAIMEARHAFESAGRTDEWNAGVRSYLQDAFDRASMSQQGLNPSMLRRQIWANADRRAAMRAAMTPDQFTGFDNFMGTIEDASRTYPMNSLTQPRKMAADELMAEAANTPAQNAIRNIGKLVSARVVNLLSDAADQATTGATRRNAQAMVQRLFEPDGMRYLEAMANYKPGSQQALTATARFLTQISPTVVPAVAEGRFAPEAQKGQRFGRAYDALNGIGSRLLGQLATPAP